MTWVSYLSPVRHHALVFAEDKPERIRRYESLAPNDLIPSPGRQWAYSGGK